MKRQRLGENTDGTTQVTGTEFILFAPFITCLLYTSGLGVLCANVIDTVMGFLLLINTGI